MVTWLRARVAAESGRPVALVHPSNHHHRGAVRLPVIDREPDRRSERPSLGSQTLLENLRVDEPDRAESRLLVEPQDDGPASARPKCNHGGVTFRGSGYI